MSTHPCQTDETQAQAAESAGMGRKVEVKRVDECETLDDLFSFCLPAFGGAFLRRIYKILDEAIGQGCPLTLAISGPVTVSGQHQVWLNPLLETGWVAYLSTTDAVCYHDGHRALARFKEGPVHEVPLFGDDGALRDQSIIRVADMAFPEEVLFDQDKFITAFLRSPDMQRKMTGTEFRKRLGEAFGAEEQRLGLKPGLLATCARLDIPVFVGAPGDGSSFLNSVKLWAMQRAGMLSHSFELDLHAEVFEACAYHHWGLFESESKALATFILGGGVPKNYNLQPEPTLSQILGLKDIRGYMFDVQIVSSPVTDGSLSSCYPAEAVTWGKVDKDVYQQTTESLQGDYSMLVPFLVKALLDNRARYQRWAERMGEEELFKKHPKARGYLRSREGYRLYGRRDELVGKLVEKVKDNQEWLEETLRY
jgi:deoxyhypusine synthase